MGGAVAVAVAAAAVAAFVNEPDSNNLSPQFFAAQWPVDADADADAAAADADGDDL